MTFPYIGKNKHGVKALIYSRNSARILNGECAGQMHDMSVVDNDWFERKYENITADYLRNTKVKVESEEHSEFLQYLVFSIGGSWKSGSKQIKNLGAEWHLIDDELLISNSHQKDCDKESMKLITLPLPPKESEEWPQVGDRVYVTSEVMKNNLMQEAAELISETYCQVVARFTHNDFDFCVLKNTDSAYTTLIIDLCINDKTIVREKPPTPEEELESKIGKYLKVELSAPLVRNLTRAIINGEIKGLSYEPE